METVDVPLEWSVPWAGLYRVVSLRSGGAYRTAGFGDAGAGR